MSDFLRPSWPGHRPTSSPHSPCRSTYRAALVGATNRDVRRHGVPDKDPRKSLHVEDVAVPELAPDEAYVAVMATSINFNTVWTSIFEPLPTFGFLERLGRERVWGARHDLHYHVVGSDASGVVMRTGSAVRNWKAGDKVMVHCNYVDDQDPSAHDDSMLAANQRIWGFETNFGGLADLAVVRANQLMPKPAHLSWEEAAVNALCNSTAYRMLVSHNGAADEAGRRGAGVGRHRGPRQLRRAVRPQRWRHPRRGGLLARKVALLHDLGVEAVIDRRAADYRFWNDEHTQDESEWRRFGKDIRGLVGEDPDIVFEHPGRQTMGASVFVCKRGGIIVTCAATSGYMIEYDNRHLWMKLKTIKGSHFANYREAWQANRLLCLGKILPPLSAIYPLDGGGRGGLPGSPQPARGQDRRAVPGPRRGSGNRRPGLRARGRRGPDHGVPQARRMIGGHAHRDRSRRHRRAGPRCRRRLVRGRVRRHRRPPRGGRA